jgi:hypothetical protein
MGVGLADVKLRARISEPLENQNLRSSALQNVAAFCCVHAERLRYEGRRTPPFPIGGA